MKDQARVVVIGGGVVGCSVLYHLVKFGWKDVVLVERDELTSGSTWHAAGGMHTINGDPNVAKLQKYTISLYQEIEELSEQKTGLHVTGGVMLAATKDRFDWLKSMAAKGRYLDIDAEIISPKEAHDIMPLLDPSCFVGAMRTSVDGHLDPSGTTHAYAKAARKLGAEVYRHTKVEAISQNPDKTWTVSTSKGTIRCEHVVNAGGLWAREVGRMVGLELPVLAMEHMYLLTEDMPEVAEINKATGKEVVHAVDFDGELYLRQERGGMLMGTYEKACVAWSELNTPWNFGHELLEPDIERISPSLEVGFKHFPAFQNAGIRQIINGPFTFAPDGNPLVGPVRGLEGFWCACGVMAGFSQGGGVGLALANWMMEGDPGFDVFAMDVARFGNWASMRYTNAKVKENYSRRFSIKYPNEELTAARGLKTTPIYDLLKANGAQFGAVYGLEVPLWFAPPGVEDQFSWRRSTDFDAVGEEAKALRRSVGMAEISSFANYRIEGGDAETFLDHILAARLPKKGRMTLAPMLNEKGGVVGDFTLAKLDEQSFMLTGSGVAEEYHLRLFEQLAKGYKNLEIDSLGLNLCGLAIAGPNSRALLQELVHEDISHENFKFMAIKKLDIGMAPALVGRVSYTGDLGYEIWMKPEYQRYIFESLMKAGEKHDLKLVGSRATNSLRLEKGYGSWAREFRPIYNAVETGLIQFAALKKEANFIGKEAATSQMSNDNGYRLKTFTIDVADADVIGDEPVFLNGAAVGWVTSGGYCHHSGVSAALAFIPVEHASGDQPFEIEILGKRYAARIQHTPLFDANGEKMRT